ncbi:MAG: MarR family transcriptional regulator [Promethearchaeota archaeon]
MYETINKKLGLTIYNLMKEVNWTSGKVNHYIQKLLKDRIIKISTEIENGRVKKQYFPVSYKELINWDEMNIKPEE